MYPTSYTAPKFYGLPKIHKTGTHLRPIAPSTGSVTYGVAKVMAKVLKPLVGKLPHHIQSTSDFVSKVREVTLLPGSASDSTMLLLCSSLLEQDETWCNRTVLSVQNIIELLGFCLHNTYFSFQNKFHEQVEGVALGSPVSPIVANLFMEHFERQALRSVSPPKILVQVCG